MADITFTDATFATQVLQAKKPVLVDFWAPWCGPCRMQGPIVEEVAREMGESAMVGKLNVDENPTTASQYGIMSIPTILIFSEGKPVGQFVGVQSKETLVAQLKKQLS